MIAGAAEQDSMGVITGTVRDALSGVPLSVYGEVVVRNSNRGSGIDSAGRYTIQMPAGEYELTAGFPSYSPSHASAKVTAGDTTIVSFRLLPQRYVNDSIMASLAKVRITELRGIDNRRHPDHVDFNDSVRVAAWKTYLSGRGTFGIKKTAATVEGDPIYEYLLVENGKCRTIVDTREDAFGSHDVIEHHFPGLLLTQGKQLAPDSIHYIGIPYSSPGPKDKELRFQFLDDNGYTVGDFGY